MWKLLLVWSVIPYVHGHRMSIANYFSEATRYDWYYLSSYINISWPPSAPMDLCGQLPVGRLATELWGGLHDVWVWTVKLLQRCPRAHSVLAYHDDLKAFTLYSPLIVVCIVKCHLKGSKVETHPVSVLLCPLFTYYFLPPRVWVSITM